MPSPNGYDIENNKRDACEKLVLRP